jgi:hypothetical protein
MSERGGADLHIVPDLPDLPDAPDLPDVSPVSVLPMPDLRGSFPGPFPASPHAKDIERHAVGWLGTFPLIGSQRKLAALCDITAQGMARTFPTADPEGLFLCADLFLWLTAFDDAHSEAAGAGDPAGLVRRISEFVHLLAGDAQPTGGASVFGAALGDLLNRFRERATHAQYVNLTGHLRDNLFGMIWEAHHFGGSDQVTLDDYRAIRPHTVFVRTVMATAQIALGYELPERQRSSAPLRELEGAVADLAGWINDLASYAKEAAGGGPAPLSLPTLLRRAHGCDLEEAFRLASRMCEDRAAVARARITELTTGGTEPLGEHARAMESVAASYVWHIEHARYRSS